MAPSRVEAAAAQAAAEALFMEAFDLPSLPPQLEKTLTWYRLRDKVCMSLGALSCSFRDQDDPAVMQETRALLRYFQYLAEQEAPPGVFEYLPLHAHVHPVYVTPDDQGKHVGEVMCRVFDQYTRAPADIRDTIRAWVRAHPFRWETFGHLPLSEP